MNIFSLEAPQCKVRVGRHRREVKMKYRFYQFLLIVAGFGVAVGCATMNDLTAAAMKGHTETVNALLEAGADVNAESRLGITALIAAAGNGRTETVKALLAAGADVNAEVIGGFTALRFAELGGHTRTVRLLRKAGAKK